MADIKIDISTHAPLAGRDSANAAFRSFGADFNPRAPCGARLLCRSLLSSYPYFNPRAPCGARLRSVCASICPDLFQPTRPLRGATCPHGQAYLFRLHFNPRAPCGARQAPQQTSDQALQDFNPRAPCGARPRSARRSRSRSLFQPTRPLRGATARADNHIPHQIISTHAPLAGRDTLFVYSCSTMLSFQPTRPLRGATTTRAVR